jgi:hypothetical protein
MAAKPIHSTLYPTLPPVRIRVRGDKGIDLVRCQISTQQNDTLEEIAALYLALTLTLTLILAQPSLAAVRTILSNVPSSKSAVAVGLSAPKGTPTSQVALNPFAATTSAGTSNKNQRMQTGCCSYSLHILSILYFLPNCLTQ